jgi:ABC-type nitrate/sulfonate/bicarbonate transport system substrate-binding protein
MRIGLLRLTDAAPVIVAQELGFFAEEDVPAILSVEPSWSNIADKLAHGFLDAAVILPPLAFALALGLRGAACRLIVPQAINLGGNCITLGRKLMERLPPLTQSGPASVVECSRNFAALAKSEPVRLAVVHQYSTHNLLLRYWLAAGGTDPDKYVSFTVVPPAQMVEALEKDAIDGFCAGAPWGDVAVARGLGTNVTSTHGVWCNGPEKVFAVTAQWLEREPKLLLRAQRALLRAAQYCDKPKNIDPVSYVLSQPEYLGIGRAAIAAALPGGSEESEMWQRPALRFFRHAATMPWLSHAEWHLAQMQRWGQIPPETEISKVASDVYRPALYRAAAQSLGISAPLMDRKSEGHAAAWAVNGVPNSIAMEPDGFCDGNPHEVTA